MARKVVVYDKTTRHILAVFDYDAPSIAAPAWLQSLDVEGLSYVDVDNVTATSDFDGRTVDATVVEKSSEPSLEEAKFPRSDKLVLTVPKTAKQSSTMRIEVAVKDPDEIGVRAIAGTVAYSVLFDGDVHASGDITLAGGTGYVDVALPAIVQAGQHTINRVLVRAIKDNNTFLSAGAWVEMTV